MRTSRALNLGLRFIAPAMRVGAALAEYASAHIPRPFDDPHGFAPGPHPDRILVLGAGPAVGWGVTSHTLALPGALARALAARTGRGCTVDLVADPHLDSATAHLALHAATLTRYDGIIIVLGVNDALRFTPTTTWRRHLETLLDTLTPRTGRVTPILVTGVQPVTSLKFLDSLTGALADSHARRLNTVTSALCNATPQATFVPLPGATSDGNRHRSPAQYDRWARVILEPLANALAELRPHPENRFVLTPLD